MKKEKKWGWSFAVIREKKSSGRWAEFVLKEIYGGSTPDSWTKDGITFAGDTPKDIVKGLKMAIKDIEGGLVLEVKGRKLVRVKKIIEEEEQN